VANGRHVAAKPHIAIAFIAVMFSVALLPNASLAEVYKCKDAKGKVTYSDSPCQKQAAQLAVDRSIQFENSAAGRQAAATSRSEAARRKTQEAFRATQANVDECNKAINRLMDMAGGRSNSVAFARQKMAADALCGTNRGDAAGVTSNTVPNHTIRGNSVDSANRDFDVRMNAKRDYQKQQIPGFITHQPTDAHERGVYKQEMNRQKNIDPNTWNH
jgi:hypothetical protein